MKRQKVRKFIEAELTDGSLVGRESVRLENYCAFVAHSLGYDKVSGKMIRRLMLGLGVQLNKVSGGRHEIRRGDHLTIDNLDDWLINGNVQLRDQIASGMINTNENLLDQTADLLVENEQFDTKEQATECVMARRSRLLPESQQPLRQLESKGAEVEREPQPA